MTLHELLSEATLAKHNIGFGLTQYVGEKYSLVGGYRSGGADAGESRLKFDVMDHELYDKTQDLKKAKLGGVELRVQNSTGNILGLINIKLTQKKTGLGSSIVSDIVDTAGGRLEIHDIKPAAKQFWIKVGAEFVRGAKYDAVIQQ
jgi:hypothetical protein